MIGENELNELQESIGYHFKDSNLLLQALTHSSYANEQKINKRGDYERLEFLGDAVLELVSSHYLYNKYPDKKEGEMTKMRASMVCEPALAYCASSIHLEKYLILGKGEEATGGRYRESIISDVMEAIIGAIYLDSGIKAAKAHIEKFILDNPEEKQIFYDSKSVLQEMVQRDNGLELRYEICGEKGPEHDKIFESAVYVGDKKLGEGSGRTKKAAEQKAAYQAILELKKE
ncbi:ribonuclease III [Butyrivibrio sp. INlla16]|uniref:ribonuclease III n=1 Tax=Butyrivibrio sp. INlla16 TaxID=1520807 RepID=UPI0008926EEC|nr:ribonuclease III [Butyrivibrio sp. INlla16]SDB48963.1 ribonuclease-3 [Butyrivibrio sp. INlla16]